MGHTRGLAPANIRDRPAVSGGVAPAPADAAPVLGLVDAAQDRAAVDPGDAAQDRASVLDWVVAAVAPAVLAALARRIADH